MQSGRAAVARPANRGFEILRWRDRQTIHVREWQFPKQKLW